MCAQGTGAGRMAGLLEVSTGGKEGTRSAPTPLHKAESRDFGRLRGLIGSYGTYRRATRSTEEHARMESSAKEMAEIVWAGTTVCAREVSGRPSSSR